MDRTFCRMLQLQADSQTESVGRSEADTPWHRDCHQTVTSYDA